jgi:hypothetical protein
VPAWGAEEIHLALCVTLCDSFHYN